MNKKEYWLEKWVSGDVKFNQEEVNPFLLKYYSELGLKHASRIFLPLCGKSIDMLWLSKQGHFITGVELSPIACKAFFELNNISYAVKKTKTFDLFYSEGIELYCGDFFLLTQAVTGDIDAVYDRGALIALPPQIQIDYAKKLLSLMNARSKVLLLTIDYDQSLMEGPPFSTDNDTICRLYGGQLKIKTLLCENYMPSEHMRDKGLNSANRAVYLMRSNI